MVLEWFGPEAETTEPEVKKEGDEKSAEAEGGQGKERRPIWRYEFRAVDALKRVHRGPSVPGDGCVKVGYSEAWLKSRSVYIHYCPLTMTEAICY